MNDWSRIRLGMLALVLVASCGGRSLRSDAGSLPDGKPSDGSGAGGGGRGGAGGAGGGAPGLGGSSTGGAFSTGGTDALGGRAGAFSTGGTGGLGGRGGAFSTGGAGPGGIGGRGGAGGFAGSVCITGCTGGTFGLGGRGGTGFGGAVGMAGRGGFGVGGEFSPGGRGGFGFAGFSGTFGGPAGVGGPGGFGFAGRGGFFGDVGGRGGFAASAGFGGRGGFGGFGGTAGAPCLTCRVDTLAIPGRDLVYNPVRNEIYTSIYGDDPLYANTIVVINPQTSAVITTIPVGSNPGALALSDDGSTLWVAIDGAHAFRKVTLTSTPPVLGPLHRLPKSPSNAYFNVGEMLVLPGSPLSVAISMTDVYGYAIEVRVFDDGVSRATGIKNTSTANHLAAGPAGTVYGSGGYSNFFVMPVASSGITQMPFFNFFRNYPTNIVYTGGRVYSSTGDIIDVATSTAPFRANTLNYQGPVAILDAMRVLMLTTSSFTFPFNTTPTVRVFSTGAMPFEITRVVLPPVASSPYNTTYTHLIYAGADTVAFLKSSYSYTQEQELVIAHDPAFGTPTGGASGTGGAGGAGGTGGAPDPCPGCSFITSAAYGRHLVHDASRNLIYVSADATAVSHPSTIVTVDPAVGTVTSIVPVGNDPQPLALSDDSSVLWVGLAGDRRVRRMTPGATPVPGPAYSLPMLLTTGEPSTPAALVVLPGTPTSIAVGVYGTQVGGRGVFILDDGQPRANFIQPPEIAAAGLVNGAPGYLLALGDSSNLVVFRLGTVGATYESFTGLVSNSYYQGQGLLTYQAANAYAYTSNGEVIDMSNPDDPLPVGKFAYYGCALAVRSSSRVLMLCPDPAGQRGPMLRVLDTNTFASIGSLTLPDSFAGTAFADFAYLGGDAVAFIPWSQPLTVMHAPLIGNQP